MPWGRLYVRSWSRKWWLLPTSFNRQCPLFHVCHIHVCQLPPLHKSQPLHLHVYTSHCNCHCNCSHSIYTPAGPLHHQASPPLEELGSRGIRCCSPKPPLFKNLEDNDARTCSEFLPVHSIYLFIIFLSNYYFSIYYFSIYYFLSVSLSPSMFTYYYLLFSFAFYFRRFAHLFYLFSAKRF